MKAKKEILTSVRLSKDTAEKLKNIANRKETSIAALIREAVVLFLAKKSHEIK